MQRVGSTRGLCLAQSNICFHQRSPFSNLKPAGSPEARRVLLSNDQRKYQQSATVNHPRRVLYPRVTAMAAVDFPIPEDKLIKLAQKVLLEDKMGQKNDEVLADDFRFEFPIVKLSKKEYVKVIRTFNIEKAFSNFAQNPYDWRVDKYEPQRVCFTTRMSGTHDGDLKIFDKYTYKATGRQVYGSPEAMSMTFNEQGKVTSFTGGYVMDNRLGNMNNLGALLGILQGIGIFWPHPQPGTLGWKVGCVVDTGVNFIKVGFHFFTFGIFKGGKQKSA